MAEPILKQSELQQIVDDGLIELGILVERKQDLKKRLGRTSDDQIIELLGEQNNE